MTHPTATMNHLDELTSLMQQLVTTLASNKQDNTKKQHTNQFNQNRNRNPPKRTQPNCIAGPMVHALTMVPIIKVILNIFKIKSKILKISFSISIVYIHNIHTVFVFDHFLLVQLPLNNFGNDNLKVTPIL